MIFVPVRYANQSDNEQTCDERLMEIVGSRKFKLFAWKNAKSEGQVTVYKVSIKVSLYKKERSRPSRRV